MMDIRRHGIGAGWQEERSFASLRRYPLVDEAKEYDGLGVIWHFA